MSQPRQVRVTSEPTRRPGQGVEAVAFFDEDGNPIDIGGGDSGPVTWGSVTNKPSTFPPANHEHTTSEVTGLQDQLDALAARLDDLEG